MIFSDKNKIVVKEFVAIAHFSCSDHDKDNNDHGNKEEVKKCFEQKLKQAVEREAVKRKEGWWKFWVWRDWARLSFDPLMRISYSCGVAVREVGSEDFWVAQNKRKQISQPLVGILSMQGPAQIIVRAVFSR
ncbi:hypothetical protein LWI29_004770 [Acer saccharum]|uniref:Uncharacterized protein n=1 Tax=Acer saccharum TaxID=4024 RepID=A0AA39RI80_ACESA|nr:hypothetical protein LWI29_004770 [Acer saccharum]